jgi:hypothetical protein
MEYLASLGDISRLKRPSLFELVAQEKMSDMLSPVVEYLLSQWAQRYPRYLIHVLNRHDEVYAVLMALIEFNYLKKKSKLMKVESDGLMAVTHG